MFTNVFDCIGPCPGGSYFDFNETSCQECPIGFYQPINSSDVCALCPDGLITVGTGSVGEDSCKKGNINSFCETYEIHLNGDTVPMESLLIITTFLQKIFIAIRF